MEEEEGYVTSKRGVNRHRIGQDIGLSYTAVLMIAKHDEDQGIGGLEIGAAPVTYVMEVRGKIVAEFSVINRSKTKWRIIDGNFYHEQLIEFIDALIQQVGSIRGN